MSSFKCEKCGAEIVETEHGYITGCDHYPLNSAPTLISVMLDLTVRVKELEDATYNLSEDVKCLKEDLIDKSPVPISRNEVKVSHED